MGQQPTRIAPSMLCADFRALEEDARRLAEAGVEWLHFDCMDGQFVESLTYGPLILGALREGSALFFDAHLMVREPQRQIAAFAEAGADGICVHREVLDRPAGVLGRIRDFGCMAGLALNPATPLDGLEVVIEHCDYLLLMSVEPGSAGQGFMRPVLRRIERVRELIEAGGLTTLIQVDGGINAETAAEVISAGADVLVSGSFLFGHPEGYSAAAKVLRGL